MTTLLDIIQKGTSFLEKKGVESARLNMERIACCVLEVDRMGLYLRYDEPLRGEQIDRLRVLTSRRGTREPLQHILGEIEFFGRRFLSDRRGLIPRPETEELVELVLQQPRPDHCKILDVGCGSGVIGLTLKAELGMNASVTLCDISGEALALSRENASTLGVDVEFLHSDLLTNVGGDYDLIVSNPPYVSSNERDQLEAELAFDPEIALFSGDDGLNHVRKLIPQAYEKLTQNGALVMEIGYDQHEAVEVLCRESGFSDVESFADLSKIMRFPIARKI